MRERRFAVAVVLGLILAGCSSDGPADDAATTPTTTSSTSDSTAPPVELPTTDGATTDPTQPADTDPDPTVNDGGATDGAVGGASDLLPFVSLLSLGEVQTSGAERALGEFTRCVAGELDPSVPSFGPLDPDEDPDVVIASLDPDVVATITPAMDSCISPVVLFARALDSRSIERDEYAGIRCLIETLGGEADWADVVTAFQTGADELPFGDTTEAFSRCGQLPGADESLTPEEDEFADALGTLGELVGLELSRGEARCIVVESRGSIDPNVTVDLADLDIEVLAPVLATFDTCVPLGGVIAELDDGAVVYSLCLDENLAGSVGWRELVEFGLRAEDFTDEQIEADPVVVALDAARAACRWSEPGQQLADLDEVLDIEVLVHDGTRLWAGGVDEGGGTSPGNVLVLDGATGAVVTAIETDTFSVEIITSDQDEAWIVDKGGEWVLRVNAADGTADAPILLPGREVGDLQVSADSVWVTDNLGGALLRLDRGTGEVVDEIAIAPGDWFSSDLALVAGSLWLTNREDRVVRQFDPATGALVAQHTVDSEFTTNLLDLGAAVGVYGFSELWRIDPAGSGPEQVVKTFGQEDLDVDTAAAVGGLVAFADEDISTLAIYDLETGVIEQTRFFSGVVAGEPDRIASDGTAIWLTTIDNRLMRFDL